MPQTLTEAGLTGVLIVDLCIGFVFAILVFSLVASALYEAIAGVLNYRGMYLLAGIARLVRMPGPDAATGDRARAFVADLMGHPLIVSLKGPKTWLQRGAEYLTGQPTRHDAERLPSAIPADVFARALVETLVFRDRADRALVVEAGALARTTAETARARVAMLAVDRRTQARLIALIDDIETGAGTLTARVHAEIDAVQDAVALSFDRAMARVSGWYVRRTKVMLFVIGTGLAGTVNFDVLGYGQAMVRDEAMRTAVLMRAQAAGEARAVGAFTLDAPAGAAAGAAERPEGTEALHTLADTAAEGLALVGGLDVGRGHEQAASGAPAMGQDSATGGAEVVGRSAAAGGAQAVDGSGAEAVGRSGGVAEPGAPVLGWDRLPRDPLAVLRLVLSWALIGIGCTMGGQFWFDILTRALRVRIAATGILPGTAASEQRRTSMP